MPETEWRELWSKARSARDAGRISQALSLYSATLNATPPVGEPYSETGSLVADLCNKLAGLDQLEEAHRHCFGLSPQEFPIRVRGGMIGPDGWRYAADALARAVELRPQEMKWREELAAILERLGRLGDAIACRRAAAELSNSLENEIATAQLLAVEGEMATAARQYEALLDKWGPRPALILPLAAIYRGDGSIDKARLLEKRIAASIAKSRPDSERDVTLLLELSQTAAKFHLPLDAKEFVSTLFSRCCDAVDENSDSPVAWLAKGYSGLANGDASGAKQCFAYASMIAELQDDIQSCPLDSLAYARSYLLDLVPPTRGPWPYPVDARRLAVFHARARRAAGDVAGALHDYLKATFEASARHFYFDDSVVYKKYKIICYLGTYYAIPKDISGIVVVGGTVYRVPKFVYDRRRYIPGWLVSRLRMRTARSAETRVRLPLVLFALLWPARTTIKWAARRLLVERALRASSVSALMWNINRETESIAG